jgi:Zn-dependent peptidase ImmA (M78 family)
VISQPRFRREKVISQRKILAQMALRKSIEIRKKASFDLINPICVYDLCDALELSVRFVEISMEGMYVKGTPSGILLSALRPLPRRNFTCAHEIGHHAFDHGSTIDELMEDRTQTGVFNPNEFLVDCFGGFLLMPTVGVRKAFAMRKWNSSTATPLQFFTVACSFGVGFETLIDHMTYSLDMISRSKANALLKFTPKIIREELLRRSSGDPLIIADEQWLLPTIDVEVGSQLLLPNKAKATSDTITFQEDLPSGRLFRANRPGIVRVYCPDSGWAVFVRISRFQFVGLSKYRHLDEVEDE